MLGEGGGCRACAVMGVSAIVCKGGKRKYIRIYRIIFQGTKDATFHRMQRTNDAQIGLQQGSKLQRFRKRLERGGMISR